MKKILATFKEQQRKEGPGKYRFERESTRQTETLGGDGYGSPVKPVDLIASCFRPSDDATTMLFLVPSNFMAVSAMGKAAEILSKVNKRQELSQSCEALTNEVATALKKYVIIEHPKYGKIYAFEVDGYGGQVLMDDANNYEIGRASCRERV